MYYMVVEQTKEYKNRVVYDPLTNSFSESGHVCLFSVREFPHAYGWLKESGTPPEEHLDVFLMSHFDCALGDEVLVKIVGVFIRNDGDHKLVSILPERHENDLFMLPESEINDLYKLYPRIDEGEGWFGAKKANDVIHAFMLNGREAH